MAFWKEPCSFVSNLASCIKCLGKCICWKIVLVGMDSKEISSHIWKDTYKNMHISWCYFCQNKLETTSVQFSSVGQSCPTLCDPMNRSMPGLPVHHQLPEFTQTHVHRVGDAIQPSHPLSSPFPPAPNPSQHQSLFQWVNSSQEVAKYWSFSFGIIPSKEIPGLISFTMDWLDLLAAPGTL